MRVVDGSPTVRRRRLGLILRGLRERAGLTGEEVGTAIERSGSWVSRVETGRVGLRSRDLNDLLELYGVRDQALRDELLALAREGKQRGWWSKYADTLAGPYATYIGFESEAAELLVYETLVVHGLLQTEEYARAIFGAAMLPRNTGDMVERKVKVRMERQELLTRAQPAEGVGHPRRVGAAPTDRWTVESSGASSSTCSRPAHAAERHHSGRPVRRGAASGHDRIVQRRAFPVA